jgi:hypothetical protein
VERRNEFLGRGRNREEYHELKGDGQAMKLTDRESLMIQNNH